jgi:dihydrofolate synthase/folylpolyglutamate synthase
VPHDDPVARLTAELNARHPHVMLPGLSRMTDLVDLLGSPQRAYPSIHITGTNGKTSTARMIDALLRAHDLRTGLYTSPHLEAYVERIAIDGAPIDPERLAEVWDEIAPLVGLVDERHEERMTFFEVGTALAFAAFADTPVDVGVIEVGLGGTWDSTNVIDAGVAVITPISLDHTELLGDSVAEIAGEKAGIIHAGATAVVGGQQPEALEVLLARCEAVGARAVVEGRDLAVLDRRLAVGGQLVTLATRAATYEDILLPLFGEHQAHNAVLALAAVEAFLGGRPLDAEVVREGFAAATSPGRLEIVRTSPTVILDGAHNPAGAAALAAGLRESFDLGRLVVVVGMLADKDAVGFLEQLAPIVDHLVATEPASPRALPAEDLADIARDILGEDDDVSVAPALPEAIDRAVAQADVAFAETGESGGVGVLITGSLVTVGEARTLLRRR